MDQFKYDQLPLFVSVPDLFPVGPDDPLGDAVLPGDVDALGHELDVHLLAGGVAALPGNVLAVDDHLCRGNIYTLGHFL